MSAARERVAISILSSAGLMVGQVGRPQYQRTSGSAGDAHCAATSKLAGPRDNRVELPKDLRALGKGGQSMASLQPRHDDIVIQRRFSEQASTHAVKQIYAVTYPGHSDLGTERESYDEAEQMAIMLAQDNGLSVWYEENPQSGRRTLVKSFRDAN